MNHKTAKIIVFADLDGSLLNEKYEYAEIEHIILELLSLGVCIVFDSSKTRNEIEFYRNKLRINDPFIVENGSAIFIPKNYFKTEYSFTKSVQGYHIIELGRTYSEVRKKLAYVKERTDASIVGFGDMTTEEIARDCELPLILAKSAKKREYDEPLKILKGDQSDVLEAISDTGLCYAKGGRYIHVMGNCDKGKAAEILKNLYLKENNGVLTIGVGDSPNDLPMLNVVDKPFFVDKTKDRNAINNVWQEIILISKKKT